MAAINYSYAERNLSSPGNTKLGNIADDSETTKAVKTFVLSSLIAVAISGNSLVIASVYRNINKRMRVASNFLVVNLSIADFFLAIFSLSRLIGLTYMGFEWPFGGVFGLISCKAYNFFIAFLLYVSTMNFMAIAFDRFVAVFFPLSGIMKGKLLYFVISLTWIIPGCFFSFFWKMMNIEVRLGIIVCYANVLAVFPSVKAFFNFLFAQYIIVISIPIATTIALYAAIGVKLRQRRPPGNQQEVSVVHSEWTDCTSRCSNDGNSDFGILFVLESSVDYFHNLQFIESQRRLQKSWCRIPKIRCQWLILIAPSHHLCIRSSRPIFVRVTSKFYEITSVVNVDEWVHN